MQSMTSKERFAATLEHRQPDRAPIDYHAHPDTDARLRQFLGVETESQLLDNLGCDFYVIRGRCLSQNELLLPQWKKGTLPAQADTERTCPLGIRYLRQAFDGKFAVDEAIAGPFENVTGPKEILDHPWPKAADFDFEPWLAECEANAERLVSGGINAAFFGNSYRMLGYENFLLSLAAEPEIIKTLIDRMVDMYLELNEKAFSTIKGKVDVYLFGNDYGSQESLLMSRQMWLDYCFENTKRICDQAHSYGVKVIMHSCGAIFELIGDLIEAGVDILDPIQLTAKGMDMHLLKDTFGDRLVFHGGVDTQHILPSGTPDEVRAHSREILDVLGKDGGYIFSPSQLLSQDIPSENIEAMYRVATA